MTPKEDKLNPVEEDALRYALVKMKLKKHSIFRSLFLIFLLCSIQFIDLGFALVLAFVLFLYKAYVYKVFKYVYHYEVENESLKLYLLNILGEKRAVVFMRSDINKLVFSEGEQTISISDKVGTEVFKVVSLSPLHTLKFELPQNNMS